MCRKWLRGRVLSLGLRDAVSTAARMSIKFSLYDIMGRYKNWSERAPGSNRTKNKAVGRTFILKLFWQKFQCWCRPSYQHWFNVKKNDETSKRCTVLLFFQWKPANSVGSVWVNEAVHRVWIAVLEINDVICCPDIRCPSAPRSNDGYMEWIVSVGPDKHNAPLSRLHLSLPHKDPPFLSCLCFLFSPLHLPSQIPLPPSFL